MMTLIIAYPHGDAAWLLNGTVGAVLSLRLPNFVPAKKIEVLLAPLCSFLVLTTVFSATFPTTALQTKVYRNQPFSLSFPSYQESTIVTRSLLKECHMF